MKLKIYSRVNSKKILMGIKQLLVLCDKEFVPPLSSRGSTTQSDLISNADAEKGIDDYFNEISKQGAVVAMEGGKVVGFISFKNDYVCDILM